MRSVNLTIVQGTPFEFLVRLEYKDVDGDQVPLPIPGAFVQLQARPRVDSETLLLDLNSNGNGISVDGLNGTFRILLSSGETSSLNWDCNVAKLGAVYQCEVTPVDNETFRALKGTLTLDPEVVR